MYPLSAAYRAAIAGGGYRVAAAVHVYAGSEQVAALTAETGSFTVDRNAAQRRRCQLTITPAPGVFPTTISAPLTPFGNEIRPYFGVQYANGSTELIPMGVYVMTTVTGTVTSADTTISVAGYDRSWTVAQRKFLGPYQVSSSDPGTAIQAILNAQAPGLPPLNMTPTGFSLPSPLPTFKQGDDPWAACLTIADAAGCELFFDLQGVPVGRPIPNPAQQPTVWSFTDGPAGPTSLSRGWTREGVSNDFTVIGSGANVQPPVSARAQDTSPGSPTYVSGSFGDVPSFINSSLVTSTAAAQAAASNALTAALGLVESVTLESVPNPAWDVDDVASVVNRVSGCNGRYVVDSIQHVFHAADSTRLSMRAVTV